MNHKFNSDMEKLFYFSRHLEAIRQLLLFLLHTLCNCEFYFESNRLSRIADATGVV